MSRFVHQPKSRRRSRERLRLTFTVVAFGVLLGSGLFAGGQYFYAKQRSAVAAASGDQELYTGSILYMPFEGRICRQMLFDNQTGRLLDNGSVDCERAAYRGSDGTPKRWSSARLRVISTGFRDR
jgi:hypothetical protein